MPTMLLEWLPGDEVDPTGDDGGFESKRACDQQLKKARERKPKG